MASLFRLKAACIWSILHLLCICVAALHKISRHESHLNLKALVLANKDLLEQRACSDVPSKLLEQNFGKEACLPVHMTAHVFQSP